MSSIPFTYLIGWSNLRCYYYGVKVAKNSTPKSLWTTYFTSSSLVKKVREQYGEPDVIQVRQTFSTKEKAYEWETKVLRRLKVKNSKIWLNKSENSGFIGISKKPGKPKNFVTMRDVRTGCLITVHCNDPKILSGEYVHPTKGTKSVFDTENNIYCRIPVEETSPRYIPINKGFIVVRDKINDIFIRIKKDFFDPGVHEFHRSRGKKSLTKEQREFFSSRMRGELNPSFGKPGTFTGKKHSKESIDKIKATKAKNKSSQGKNNPMYGKSAVRGRKWYNNGEKTFYLFPDDPLTADLHLGRKLNPRLFDNT